MQLAEMYHLLYIVIALSVFQPQNDINDVKTCHLIAYRYTIHFPLPISLLVS